MCSHNFVICKMWQDFALVWRATKICTRFTQTELQYGSCESLSEHLTIYNILFQVPEIQLSQYRWLAFAQDINWKLPAAFSRITCSLHVADLQSPDNSTFCCSNSCEQDCKRDKKQVDQMFVVHRMFFQFQIRVAQILSHPVNCRLRLNKHLDKQVFNGYWTYNSTHS